ncbi:MAG: Flp pilus assembly protein CpaB [Victivallales bacterium]|nr:Flp pilus assembly protein CpaB [Victivallales bacterium]
MRQKLLLLAAVVFGLLAFFLNYSHLQQERDKLRARTHIVRLIKMRTTKLEGETIEIADIEPFDVERFRTHTSDEIPWNSRTRDAIKHTLDQGIEKGAVLRYSDLRPEKIRGRDGLAGIVNVGERAISIAVDSTSSVTSLVKPGDRVDIIGTFRFPEMKGDKSMDVITLTLLQNVDVLATGRDMAVAKKAVGPHQQRGGGYSTVTLALTPKEVEMIIFASQKGRLVLSLRSYQETGFEKDLQSVNFRYLEEKIPHYNLEREKKQRMIKY